MSTVVIGASTPTAIKSKVKVIQETKISPVFNVSADAVWKIIGPGFKNVSVWSRAVDHASTSGQPEFEGASCRNRSCDLNASGFSKISETVIEYDANRRTLGYSVDAGIPGFVTYMANNWRVIEVGPNQCKTEMTVTMHLKPLMGFLMGGMFKKNVHKILDEVIEDLKIYAETGKISEAKEKRIAQLEKKNN